MWSLPEALLASFASPVILSAAKDLHPARPEILRYAQDDNRWAERPLRSPWLNSHLTLLILVGVVARLTKHYAAAALPEHQVQETAQERHKPDQG